MVKIDMYNRLKLKWITESDSSFSAIRYDQRRALAICTTFVTQVDCLWRRPLFLICVLLSTTNAAAQPSPLVVSVLKSMSWHKHLKSHEVEINIHRTREFDIPELKVAELSRGASSKYYESILKFRSAADSESGKFAMVCVYGNTALRISDSAGSNPLDVEDNAECDISMCDGEKVLRYDGRGQLIRIDARKKGQIFDVPRSLSMIMKSSLNPILQYNESDNKNEIDDIIDFLTGPNESKKSIHVTEVTSQGKLFEVVRYTSRVEQAVAVTGFKFTLAKEGSEKDLVVRYGMGIMKDEHKHEQFERDEQLRSNYSYFTTVEWKSFESPADAEEIILPVRIVKKGLNTMAGSDRELEICTFNWKKIGSFDAKSMALDNNVELAKRFGKEIDRTMRR